MTETTTQTATQTTTAAQPAPAVDPRVDQLMAEKAAREQAEAKAEADKAEAARSAELEKLRSQGEKHKAEAEALRASLAKRTALSALPGLKDPERFYPLVASAVKLDDAGNLTAESIAALEKFKSESPYLFETPNPGTAALGVGGQRAQTGSLSAEDRDMLSTLKITPGAAMERAQKSGFARIIGWGKGGAR